MIYSQGGRDLQGLPAGEQRSPASDSPARKKTAEISIKVFISVERAHVLWIIVRQEAVQEKVRWYPEDLQYQED